MFQQIKAVVLRSEDTILADAVGVASLMVMLVVALHLPSFV